MAKKGGSSHMKRIASPRYVPVARKGKVWVIKPSPGPHKGEEAVSLGVVLRDVVHVADSEKEVRRILKEGDVLVDGRVVRDKKFPVGLMDVLSIPKMNKNYWVGVDRKGRFKLFEVDGERVKFKLCRVEGRSVKKGATQVSFHDGRTVVDGKELKVGDTVKLAVPKQQILSVMKLEPNATCLITKGIHAGEVAVIEELYHKTGAKKAEAKLRSDGESFITVRDYIFVVGEEAQVFK
jgi:small subunit ribosomal protein S4e